ncbi:MAG: DUF4143 domain-containing protein [Spirochaetes bacterium]|nr:DUF4143 domain-containing protein [Spirochaetota bacterium]
MGGYIRRFADQILQKRLDSAGAVLIQGSKGCGKTETASQIAKSTARLDVDGDVRVRMEVDPKSVLEGDVPRLIDEWQEYPQIWNYVRREVDDRKKKGLFILTGSANPEERARMHSGAGRISTFRMRPMSLYERGWSSGEVSLFSLTHGDAPKSGQVDFSLESLAEKLTLGGWPALIGADGQEALRFMQDYVALLAEIDISRVSDKKRDPQKVMRLLKSLARNVATEASAVSLAKDASGAERSVGDETVAGYIEALERLMALEQLPAWAPHIRSSDTLRKAPKRHFVDPSLAIGALGLSAGKLLGDLSFFGFLFESLVVRDLRIYAEVHDGSVFHYRDSRGAELDAVIEFPDGSWSAFEVKMGFTAQDEAAASLLKFAEKIDQGKMGAPASLNVITATGFAHRRKDGVNVVPLQVLTA